MKKVILITGASSGTGKDVALKLLDEGYVVYGAARRGGLHSIQKNERTAFNWPLITDTIFT